MSTPTPYPPWIAEVASDVRRLADQFAPRWGAGPEIAADAAQNAILRVLAGRRPEGAPEGARPPPQWLNRFVRNVVRQEAVREGRSRRARPEGREGPFHLLGAHVLAPTPAEMETLHVWLDSSQARQKLSREALVAVRLIACSLSLTQVAECVGRSERAIRRYVDEAGVAFRSHQQSKVPPSPEFLSKSSRELDR